MIKVHIATFWLAGVVLIFGAATAPAAAPATYSEAVQSLNPIAYYEFNEFEPFGQVSMYSDSSGNGNHITSIFGTEAGAAGFLGGSGVSFDGNDSLVTPLVFDPSAGQWSIELVSLTSSPSGNTQVMVSNKNGSGIGRSVMMINNSLTSTNPNFYDSFLDGDRLPSGGPVAFGSFDHVVMTYDGVQVSYFVNGTLRGTVNKTPESGNGAWVLGSGKNQDIQFWSGILDEAVFYDQALKASDIESNYQALLGIPEPAAGALLIVAAGAGLLARRRRA